jgi:hypothetical protein
MAGERRAPDGPVADTIDLVREYVRQETLGPLRGAGRWIGYGLLGSLLVGTGCIFLVLGALRLVQTEFGDVFAGRWMSLVPYVVALVLSLIVAVLALRRVNTTPLQRDAAARKEPS